MIPATVRSALLPLVPQLSGLDAEIRQSDQAILALAKTDEMARRLMTVPGIGPITASALAASIQDISTFSGPREFAAFLGLTPRQNSSGGKERMGRVSKMGNRYLRKLLVVGAHAVLFHRKRSGDAFRNWADRLMGPSPSSLSPWRSPISSPVSSSHLCATQHTMPAHRRTNSIGKGREPESRVTMT
ncbi:transposase [Mesorhizobium australicum]|uniref:transposase n=1 Tax=Mesorhizobium australicum TaxID=536018 RepID=UPI00333B7E04